MEDFNSSKKTKKRKKVKKKKSRPPKLQFDVFGDSKQQSTFDCFHNDDTESHKVSNSNNDFKNGDIVTSSSVSKNVIDEQRVSAKTKRGREIQEIVSGVFSDSSSDEENIVEEEKFVSRINEIRVEIERNSKINKTPTINVPDLKQRFEIINHKPIEGRRNFSFSFKDDFDLAPFAPFLNEKLYFHQKIGVNFLYERVLEPKIRESKGCILADFMGLGKSIQVISLIHLMRLKKEFKCPVVLVCPKVVIKHWMNEFEKYSNWIGGFFRQGLKNYEKFTPYLIFNQYGKNERIKIIKKWSEENGVLIVGYHKFRSLASMGLSDINDKIFDSKNLLILDEGHKIKTDVNISKTNLVLSMVKTKKKVLLTGYPLQNNLTEYWYMINFIKPGYLGEKKNFKKEFVKPIKDGQGSLDEEKLKRSEMLGKIIHRNLRKYVMRRGINLLKQSIGIKKDEIIIMIEMSELQKRLYNRFLAFLEEYKKKKIRRGNQLFWAFVFMTLICNHPRIALNYVNNQINTSLYKKKKKKKKKEEIELEDENFQDSESNEEEEEEDIKVNFEELKKVVFKKEDLDESLNLDSSYKMEILFHIVFTCKKIQDKVVVFTKSIQSLNFIEEVFKSYNVNQHRNLKIRYERLDGSMTSENRQNVIDAFNREGSDIDLLIVSTLSCCEGINLSSANRVVLLDVNWNPSHDVEATSRVYRFGQNKKVFVYRLLCASTIENKVHQRQLEKMKLLGQICDDRNLNLQSIINYDDLLKKVGEDEDEDVLMDDKINDEIINDSKRIFKEKIRAIKLHEVVLSEEHDKKETNADELKKMNNRFENRGFFKKDENENEIRLNYRKEDSSLLNEEDNSENDLSIEDMLKMIEKEKLVEKEKEDRLEEKKRESFVFDLDISSGNTSKEEEEIVFSDFEDIKEEDKKKNPDKVEENNYFVRNSIIKKSIERVENIIQKEEKTSGKKKKNIYRYLKKQKKKQKKRELSELRLKEKKEKEEKEKKEVLFFIDTQPNEHSYKQLKKKREKLKKKMEKSPFSKDFESSKPLTEKKKKKKKKKKKGDEKKKKLKKEELKKNPRRKKKKKRKQKKIKVNQAQEKNQDRRVKKRKRKLPNFSKEKRRKKGNK